MFTTSQFQIKPNYYCSQQECTDSYKNKHNTNQRYKFFNQTHFTAGDIEQFQLYRDPTNGNSCTPAISLENNIFNEINFNIYWEKYLNIHSNDITNTFKYMFYKFKKGIFVKIKNNELKVFLPFSNKNFINEWSDFIKIDPKFVNMENFVRYINNMENRKTYKQSINKFVNSWYANNCLIRYEFPVSEGDTNVPIICDMLLELCKNRTIPDVEFFINRRDFPIIKRDGTEPYNHIYNNNVPLVSHKYDKYAPILSMVSNKDFSDIPIPTGDDWSICGSKDGKFFPKSRKSNETNYYSDWNIKIPTAIFRGSSTGAQVKLTTNSRLKLVKLSNDTPPDKNGIPLLDAGITNWNLRPRKIQGEKYLQTINIDEIPFKLVSTMTPQEQSKYKYIINVDGHVSAFRLKSELGMGCCILLVESEYKLWFSEMIYPYVHYVPVKKDMSDMLEIIQWCRDNDEKCKKISESAKHFYDKYLQKDGVLDYFQKILINIKTQSGFYLYNIKTPHQFQLESELIFCENSITFPITDKTCKDINTIPKQQRTYSLLKGLQYVVNMVLKERKYDLLLSGEQLIFENSSTTIRKSYFANFHLRIKTSLKRDETIHETFCGLSKINNLSKKIPNFAYIFGYYEENGKSNIITEYIEGQTLYDYIKSDKFNFNEYLNIIIQISLALEVAQQDICFIHYDLAPWNIILKYLDKPEVFCYEFGINQIYKITTQIIPIIIDYGKTHIIYKNIHYGFVNSYKSSSIQDILSILLLSIYEITNTDLNRINSEKILKLSNFFTGTKYLHQKFVYSQNGIKKLRFFLRNAKKYSEILDGNKYELEHLTPKDLIKYIKTHFNYSYYTIQTFIQEYNIGNKTQVFEYILSNTIEDKINSYTKVITKNIKNIPKVKYISLKYFIVQSIYTEIKTTYDLFKIFLTENHINETLYLKLYTDTCNSIKKIGNININKTREISLNKYDYNQLLIIAPYEEHTFTNIDEMSNIDNIIKKYHINTHVLIIKNVIKSVMNNDGLYSVPQNVIDIFNNNFKDILNSNSFIYLNNTANVITFYDICRKICPVDSDFLKTAINANYTEIIKYKKIINKISFYV